jgi:hypothetical protein
VTSAGAWLRRFVVALVSCGLGPACHREPPVATALEVAGNAERGRGDAWEAAVFGATFAVGDTLRTGGGAHARLALLGGAVVRVGERAHLRFQRGTVVGQRTPDIAVELGSAEVEVDEIASGLSIVTAVGPTRLERGAHVRVQADGQSASLEVVVGRAVMLDGAQEVAIDAGHGVRIRLGSTEIERFAFKVGEAVVEERAPRGVEAAPPSTALVAATAGPDAGAAVVAAQDAPAAVSPRGDEAPTSLGPHADKGRADISIVAGESATVHDGRTTAAVRLRLDGVCAGEVIVELGGQGHHHERLVGSHAVVLRLAAGTLPYRVSCASDGIRAATRASGVLSLHRDNGYVPLARRAPVNVIDADGRRYTVLFQTRLPQLTLAWPAAPAGRMELHLESTSGERVIDAASPQRPLPSGTVQEGTYTFWYRAPDGKQSPKTTLSVRFDNAAPTAQFFRTSPGAGEAPAGAVAVDGITVEGAKVSVGGEPLAVDGRGRFRTEARPLEGDDAVAVRLEHPRTGIHYYVRRRAAAR